MWINLIICSLIGAYLVGALPIGYLIAKYHGIDIRTIGSGNIGATNVARFLGLKYFFIVLFLDAFKAYGYLVFCAALGLPKGALLLSAVALLFGNSYSIFLNGSGGKGVATLVGIMFAINPMLCVALFATWLIALAFLRNIGIASVISAILIPLYAIVLTDMYGFLFMLLVAGWILWRHRINIRMYYMAR